MEGEILCKSTGLLRAPGRATTMGTVTCTDELLCAAAGVLRSTTLRARFDALRITRVQLVCHGWGQDIASAVQYFDLPGVPPLPVALLLQGLPSHPGRMSRRAMASVRRQRRFWERMPAAARDTPLQLAVDDQGTWLGSCPSPPYPASTLVRVQTPEPFPHYYLQARCTDGAVVGLDETDSSE